MRLALFLACTLAVWGFLGAADSQEKGDLPTAAEKPEGAPQTYEERIVVIATTTERSIFNTPRAITIVSKEDIERENHLSVVDVLDDRVGVWVEKRTTTTSDPVIRGLSGSNLLGLVDGNTLSTLWGEGGYAGDDMYGKIDADSIERIEVLRGPQSVLYGSNALGGVLNFHTKSCPFDFTDSGSAFGARFRATSGSAADESRYRLEAYAARPTFRFILGGSSRNVGDVRIGGGDIQTPTSGEDTNWDLKSEWRLSPDQDLTLSIQDVKREKVHRYYRPTQDNDNSRESISASYRYRTPLPGWELFKATVYYQDKRDLRRFYDQDLIGIARTKTYSGDLQLVQTHGAAHRITYGLHIQRDEGESADDEQFTIYTPEGDRFKAAPDTIWGDHAIYVQDEWEASSNFSFIASLRSDWFNFESRPDEFYQPPGAWDPEEDRIAAKERSLIGGLGVVYKFSDRLNVVGNYSRGYRLWAPRFGATQHAYGVVVPSGLLDPVTGDTWEVGLKSRARNFRSSLFLYYTQFQNWQIIVPGTFEGSNWYDFDQDGTRDDNESVYVTQASGDAYVYGVEVEARYRLDNVSDVWRGLDIGGGFAWNYGKDESSGDPLRHTQPAESRLFVMWDRPDWKFRPWLKLSAAVVGRYDRIPPDRLLNDPGYRLDPQDMTSPLLRAYGLPGYSAFNLRGGVDLGMGLSLTLNVENLFDKRYRQAHSRWDEPGTDVIGSIGYELQF